MAGDVRSVGLDQEERPGQPAYGIGSMAQSLDRSLGPRRFSAALTGVFGALALLMAAFLPFVWGDYWILGLADDYSWAVVGSPGRDYLWVLGRVPDLNGDEFDSALAVARANGFDVARLERTSHTSEEAADLP